MNKLVRSFINVTRIYTPSESTFYKVMLICVILKLIYLVSSDGSLSYNIRSFCNIGSFILGLYAILNYINKNKLQLSQKILLIIVVYMIILGLLQSSFYTQNNEVGPMFHTEYGYLMLFVAGSIFALKPRMMILFHNIMKIAGIISIIFGIWALLVFNNNLDEIARRDTTWNQSYNLWFAVSSCVTYWAFYALIMKKDRVIGFGVFILYFILGMLFLKRAALINTIVYISLAAFMGSSRHKMRNIFALFVGTIAILITLSYFFPTYFHTIQESIMGRFEDTASDMNDFDRQIEWKNLVADSNPFQLYFGYGVGNYAIRHGLGFLYCMHIGFYNIIYKGGFFYLIFFAYIYFKVIKNNIGGFNKSPYRKVCFCTSLAFLLSMTYEASWGYSIQPICIAAPLFFACNYFPMDPHKENVLERRS